MKGKSTSGVAVNGFVGNKQYDFFLSYSRDDANLVLSVVKELSGTGIDVFIDEMAIGWGDSINERVFSSIDAARFLVVFVTESALESKWVRKEISTALTREINDEAVVILPVLCTDQEKFFSNFPFMRDKKYLEFQSAEHLSDEMQKLIRGEAGTSFTFNHPRHHSGPVWVRLIASEKNDQQVHKVQMTWGPWYRECKVKLSASHPLFLMHSKGDDDESLPLRIGIDKPAHAVVGQGYPNGGNRIDVNPFWVDAKARIKRFYASVFLWPRKSERNSKKG